MTAGIDWMPNWPATEGWSSMFIFTSLTAPLASFTAFSMIGDSVLQGPHHGAQKSTSTGWRFDSSSTSLAKAWVVVSLIKSVARWRQAPGRGPSRAWSCSWLLVPVAGRFGPE